MHDEESAIWVLIHHHSDFIMRPSFGQFVRIAPLTIEQVSERGTLNLATRRSNARQISKKELALKNDTAEQLLRSGGAKIYQSQRIHSSPEQPENLRIVPAEKKKTLFHQVSTTLSSQLLLYFLLGS